MERFVRFGLVSMILLSLYLTYLIWLSPSNRDSIIVKNSETDVQQEEIVKAASDIYLPLQVVRINEEVFQQTNSETLVKQTQKLISDASFDDVNSKKYSSEEEFLEQSYIKNGLQLNYSSELPLTVYLETFDMFLPIEEEVKTGLSFVQVQIDLDQKKIRFLNQNEWTIIEAKITTKSDAFQEILVDNQATWMDVFRDDSLNPFQLYTDQTVKLPMYSYISSIRPYTVFRDAFFTSPRNVRSNEGSANLNFYDGSESMGIQQTQQILNFRGTVKMNESTDIFSKSYQYIHSLGTGYGSLRLFEQDSERIDYRIFVEGYPLFSTRNEGQILFQFFDNERVNQQTSMNVEIQTNLNSIQVPIPSEKEVELSSSYSVVQKLQEAGVDVLKIEQLLIGYEWKNIEDTGVVDLEPNWYVKYENQWYKYQQLLTKFQESEEE